MHEQPCPFQALIEAVKVALIQGHAHDAITAAIHAGITPPPHPTPTKEPHA